MLKLPKPRRTGSRQPADDVTSICQGENYVTSMQTYRMDTSLDCSVSYHAFFAGKSVFAMSVNQTQCAPRTAIGKSAILAALSEADKSATVLAPVDREPSTGNLIEKKTIASDPNGFGLRLSSQKPAAEDILAIRGLAHAFVKDGAETSFSESFAAASIDGIIRIQLGHLNVIVHAGPSSPVKYCPI
jgi:hypothetical protein